MHTFRYFVSFSSLFSFITILPCRVVCQHCLYMRIGYCCSMWWIPPVHHCSSIIFFWTRWAQPLFSFNVLSYKSRDCFILFSKIFVINPEWEALKHTEIFWWFLLWSLCSEVWSCLFNINGCNFVSISVGLLVWVFHMDCNYRTSVYILSLDQCFWGSSLPQAGTPRVFWSINVHHWHLLQHLWFFCCSKEETRHSLLQYSVSALPTNRAKSLFKDHSPLCVPLSCIILGLCWKPAWSPFCILMFLCQ